MSKESNCILLSILALLLLLSLFFTLREPNVCKPHGFFLGFLASFICFCVIDLFYRSLYFVVNKNKRLETSSSKQTETKTFVFVVVLKGDVWNGSTKSCLKIFLNFSYEEELLFFFFKFLILPSCRSRSQGMQDLKKNYSGMPISRSIRFLFSLKAIFKIWIPQ